jgi:hypothetical protein
MVITLLRWTMISSTSTSARSRIERSISRACFSSSPSPVCSSMAPRSSSSRRLAPSGEVMRTPNSDKVERTIHCTATVTGLKTWTTTLRVRDTARAMPSALWIA